MDEYKQFNKTYYAAKLFGGIVRDFPKLREAKKTGKITTLAVRSEDGKKSALLLTDYRGTDQVIEVAVKGLGSAAPVSAVALDHTRDSFPCEVKWRNGRLTLVKPDKNSAAFFVTFE